MKKMYIFCIIVALMSLSLVARDVLVEFKGAAFFPTGSHFKDIYGTAAALYGPEVTFQLCDNYEHWYGFASFDFLTKKGHSIGLCTPTKVSLVPLALGLKYLEPFCYGNVYVGLGFQPVHVKTRNDSPYVAQCTSKWAYGGIAKIGAIFDLPQESIGCDNFFIDLFLDYSFVSLGCHNQCDNSANFVVPLKANIGGVVLGAGLGYRF